MTKTLVMSNICFPPVLNGPAILMGNLFRHFPKNSFHILIRRLDGSWPPIDKESMLTAPYTFTHFPSSHGIGNWRQNWGYFFRLMYNLSKVTWKGIRIIQREKITNIFVVRDNFTELAAILISWLTRRKLVLWLPDLYYSPDRQSTAWVLTFERLLEPLLYRLVDKILVTAEPTQEYYLEKYGYETEVLPHSVDLKQYAKMVQNNIFKDESIKIIFTGSICVSQLSNILNMIKIVNNSPELNLKFYIFSDLSLDHLKSLGITESDKVFCGKATRSEIPSIQSSADMLFLPMTFNGEHESVVRTASPSKLPEYLLAGRPILVNAPPESYYVRYARQEGFGLVVDQPDCELLRDAILKLKSDNKLCQKLVFNSRRLAYKSHDSVKISQKLQSILDVN